MSLPDESPYSHDDYLEFAIYSRVREQITTLPALKAVPVEIEAPEYPPFQKNTYKKLSLPGPFSNEIILETFSKAVNESQDSIILAFQLDMYDESMQITFSGKPPPKKDQDAINKYNEYMYERENIIEENIALAEAAKTLYPKQWKACSKKKRDNKKD